MALITRDMAMFTEVGSRLTQGMIDNVNKSPTLVQQFIDYNNAVLSGRALAISDVATINDTGTKTIFEGGKAHIFLDFNDYWAKGQDTYWEDQSGRVRYISPDGEFSAVISHELGHVKYYSSDHNMESMLHPNDPGYLTSLTALNMYEEGEATYNNWLVRNEIIANGGIDPSVRASGTIVAGMNAINSANPNMTQAQQEVALSGLVGNQMPGRIVSGTNQKYWDWYYSQNSRNHPGAKPSPSADTVELIDFDKDGHYEQIIVHKPDGSDEITVDRSCSIYIKNPNTTVNVASGTHAVLQGKHFTVNAGQNCDLWVGGNGQYSGDSDLITVNSYGSHVTLFSDSRLNVFDQNQGFTKVEAYGNANVGLYGSGIFFTEHNPVGSNVWAGANGTSTTNGNPTGISTAGVVIANESGTITVVDNSTVHIDNGQLGSAVSSKAVYIGSNSYVDIYNAGNQKLYMNGDHSQLDLETHSSTVYANGTNNIVNIRSSDDVVYNSGTGNKVNDYAPHANIFSQGNYQLVWIYDKTSTVYFTFPTSSLVTAPIEDYYYFWGFGGNKNAVYENIKSGGIDVVNLFDESLNQGNSIAASEAIKELQRTVENDSYVSLTGTRWASTNISWAFVSDNSNSGVMIEAEYQKEIASAFDAWSEATGIHFELAKDSATANVVLKFSDLNTKDTNLLGVTSFKVESGSIKSAALIQLESPSDSLLVKKENGSFQYEQTDATLKQVAMHEIGHVLGLGTNNDPNSIAYYLLNSQNQGISSEDLDVIYSLYPELGHSPATIVGQPWSLENFPNSME